MDDKKLKFISFGKYNKLYKYMWFYIASKIIYEYFFGTDFSEQIKLLSIYSFPKDVLIQEAFNNLGIFFFSLLFNRYENKISEKDKFPKSNNDLESQSSKSSSSSKKRNQRTKTASSEIELIYNNYLDDEQNSYISSYIIIILLFCSIELKNTFFIFNLSGLDFWMFETFFVCYITLKLFKMPIYKHKKFAIYLISFLCPLFKLISTIFLLNNEEKRIFKIYHWIVPIGIIIYIFISLLRSYTFCKIKWLLDLKYISEYKFLIKYGFFGSLVCFILSIIVNFIPCANKEEFYHIDFICNVTKTIDLNNTIYYYDNFSAFFRNLWDKKGILINILYILLFIIKIFLNFMNTLFFILFIKNLSPEYLICSNSIYYFIIESIDYIYSFVSKENMTYKIFDILEELFCIIGTILYLEFIELNFCGLNHDLKETIIKRSLKETSLANLNNDDEDDDKQ